MHFSSQLSYCASTFLLFSPSSESWVDFSSVAPHSGTARPGSPSRFLAVTPFHLPSCTLQLECFSRLSPLPALGNHIECPHYNQFPSLNLHSEFCLPCYLFTLPLHLPAPYVPTAVWLASLSQNDKIITCSSSLSLSTLFPQPYASSNLSSVSKGAISSTLKPSDYLSSLLPGSNLHMMCCHSRASVSSVVATSHR